MKFIHFITLFILVFSLNNTWASEVKPDPEKRQIIAELTTLLGKPALGDRRHDLVAQVYFTVNRENEIVVLQVEADDVALEGYIKDRLNYKELKCKELKQGKEYVVPVRITSSN